MNQYKYVAFEGLDGAGKDTQMKLAHNYLKEQNKYFYAQMLSEPSIHTEAGKKVADSMKPGGIRLDPKTSLSCFIQDRAEISKHIAQTLEYSNVISSRCFLSSYLYQQTEGLSFDYIDQEHRKENIHYPDHILFYDLPVETLEKRLEARGSEREAFETFEFQNRNREIAQETFPKITQSPITIIDASGSIEEVFEKTKEQIDRIFFS